MGFECKSLGTELQKIEFITFRLSKVVKNWYTFNMGILISTIHPSVYDTSGISSF